jgi:hypothetical protein
MRRWRRGCLSRPWSKRHSGGFVSRIPRGQRILLFATFDQALVRKTEFPELVAALQEYHEILFADSKHCHTADWADAIEALPADSLGCGFHMNSGTPNPWLIRTDAEDDDSEQVPYNVLARDDRHFWVFDQLDKTVPDF